MMYVLDASVALKTVLSEPDSSSAIKIRDEFRNQIHELIAPDTFVVEVAHALTRAERRNIIQVGEAQKLLTEVMTDRPILHAHLALISRAIEISSTSGLAYTIASMPLLRSVKAANFSRQMTNFSVPSRRSLPLFTCQLYESLSTSWISSKASSSQQDTCPANAQSYQSTWSSRS